MRDVAIWLAVMAAIFAALWMHATEPRECVEAVKQQHKGEHRLW